MADDSQSLGYDTFDFNSDDEDFPYFPDEVFHGVEPIVLDAHILDLSNVPFETLEKIEDIKEETTIVEFTPSDEPSDVARFESAAVLNFVGKFPDRINDITIGHKNWLNNSNFSLTNEFCESLVTRLQHLKKLTLHNVADPSSFDSFLIGNQDKPQIINININSLLFKPKENDNNPTPKKMIIEIK